jgi:signal recognition particle subunit SRP54
VTRQAGAEWFPSSPSDAPVAIARAALEHARHRYFDVLLVDTAGRLAIDEKLMAEIRDLHAALNRSRRSSWSTRCKGRTR